MQEIEIRGDGRYASVLVDGKEVRGVKGVVFEQYAGEVPSAIIELVGFPGIKTVGNVMYVSDRESVEVVAKYMHDSIEKDEALRDEFESRIFSVLDSIGNKTSNVELAKKILDEVFNL